jgi:type II secretion system protein N
MNPLNRLSEGQKRWARRIGYPALFVVVFIFALHFTFPYDRFEDLAHDALTEYYEVSDLDIGPGWWPGHVKVAGLALKTRPEHEGEKPIEFRIDSADVNVGFLALLGGGFEVDIDAEIGDGEVWVHVEQDDETLEYEAETEGLPLKTVPGIKSVTGGVPIEGGLNAELSMVLPKGKWKEADGYLEFSCDGCTMGDGVAKIRPTAPGQTNAFTNEGLTLPKLRLGKIGGRMAVKKGIGEFEKFEAKSPDGELYVEAEVRFDDPFKRSQVTGYLRFKSSDELKKREEKMADMETMMAGAGKRPDGTIGVKIGPGAIDKLRFVPSKTSPIGGGRDKTGKGLSASARPPLGATRLEPTSPTTPLPATPASIPDAAAPVPGVTAAPVPPTPTDERGERPEGKGDEKMEPVHPEPPEPPPPEPAPQPPPEDQTPETNKPQE